MQGDNDRVDGNDVSPSAVPLSPLFRWPGGKRWLVPRLLELIPKRHGRYYEPFLGGGALFFALRPSNARLGDKNAELMNAYSSLRDDPAQVGRLLRGMRMTKTHYYEVRDNLPIDRFERAARTIYLTTLAFNGIYRVNRSGQFNVPYGGREYPALGSDKVMKAYSEALQGAELEASDFKVTLRDADLGDVVYLDPPYTVAHSNNGFVKYNARIFLPGDQKELAALAAELAQRGCHVFVSNAHHDYILGLYRGFRPIEVNRTSFMAASAVHRKKVREYVFTNV